MVPGVCYNSTLECTSDTGQVRMASSTIIAFLSTLVDGFDLSGSMPISVDKIDQRFGRHR
jgi:hypothetical protein